MNETAIASVAQLESIFIQAQATIGTARVTLLRQANVAIAQWLPPVRQRTDPTLLILDSFFVQMIKTSSMKSRLKWTTRCSKNVSPSGCGRVRDYSPKRNGTTASRALSIAVDPKYR